MLVYFLSNKLYIIEIVIYKKRNKIHGNFFFKFLKTIKNLFSQWGLFRLSLNVVVDLQKKRSEREKEFLNIVDYPTHTVKRRTDTPFLVNPCVIRAWPSSTEVQGGPQRKEPKLGDDHLHSRPPHCCGCSVAKMSPPPSPLPSLLLPFSPSPTRRRRRRRRWRIGGRDVEGPAAEQEGQRRRRRRRRRSRQDQPARAQVGRRSPHLSESRLPPATCPQKDRLYFHRHPL